MEGEHSPTIHIMGDMLKAPLSEASTASSLSDTSSRGAASDAIKAEAEDVMDPCEFARSYDLGHLRLLWDAFGSWKL
jgi:hypothetical protein